MPPPPKRFSPFGRNLHLVRPEDGDPFPINNEKLFTVALGFMRTLMLYHRYEVQGIENIPRVGAALIVVNHSLATYDSILLGAEIYLRTGRFSSGLADRRIFQTPGLAQLFAWLGAEEGSPESGFKLLQAGRLLMVAPGGMKESLRPSQKRYQIQWQNRLGFARLAIRAQVPVLLAACPAADDLYTVYPNPLTPFIYENFRWPLPLVRGLGLSLLPRPVKLVHVISPPLLPPPLQNGIVDENDVRRFHGQLIYEMDALMAQAAPRSPHG